MYFKERFCVIFIFSVKELFRFFCRLFVFECESRFLRGRYGVSIGFIFVIISYFIFI